MRQHHYLLVCCCLFFLGGSAWFWFQYVQGDSPEFVSADVIAIQEESSSNTVEEALPLATYTISEGDTFGTILEKIGVSEGEQAVMVEATKDVYDVAFIRLGKTIRYYQEDDRFIFLEYDINQDEQLIIERQFDDFIARRVAIEYSVEEQFAAATIESSFFLAGQDAGLPEALIITLAEIFGWSIDFATEVQSGDRFRVFYEKRYRDGKESGFGNIFAAEFNINGKGYSGYLFPDEEGKDAYYDAEGNSLVRQFLKAPLRYSRITSGFSYARFHPVIGQTTEHRAIDYAAAIGTPVYATADGVISVARWNGGFGNYIDIRHNDIYATQYAHLSGYAKGIRPGVRVAQGQLIGYVGSTGYSTGPHLHYQIRKHGSLVNPLTIELPAGDPVAEADLPLFEQRRDAFQLRLAEVEW